MKCVHCGANIPDGQLICPRCNAEVQMVPDYNPLDDVLAREVKGSVEGATRQIRTDDVRRQRQMSQTQSVRSTRVLNENEMERLREARRENLRRSKEQQNRRQADLKHSLVAESCISRNMAQLLTHCPYKYRESATGGFSCILWQKKET